MFRCAIEAAVLPLLVFRVVIERCQEVRTKLFYSCLLRPCGVLFLACLNLLILFRLGSAGSRMKAKDQEIEKYKKYLSKARKVQIATHLVMVGWKKAMVKIFSTRVIQGR